MNTKSNLLKSIFISLILVIGVSNAWAAGQYNLNWQGKVYFLVPEKWNINIYSYIQVDITRTTSASSSNYQYYAGTMTQVGTSRLYYLDLSADHSSWKQNEYLAFTANDHEYSSGTFNLDGNVLRTKPIDYGCNNSSNFYLFKPNSESNFNTTTNDNTMSGDWNSKRDDLLLKKQTIDLYLGDTKSNTGGTVKMTGYYFTSNTAIASSSLTSSSSSVSYDAVVGTEMTLIATPKAGYSFVGWYDGETLLSSEEEYTYCVYGTKTITARFEQEVVEPSITISTTQQYLRVGTDKLQLTINHENIPENSKYRVHCTTTNGYYPNSSGLDNINISGSGTINYTSQSSLELGTNIFVVEIYNSSSQKILTSNEITVTVQQDWEVAVYKKIENNDTYSQNIKPTENIGVEVTAEVVTGYAFTSWTSNTDNITFEDASAPSTLVYAKSGGNIYANYTKENCVYFVNTGNWNTVYAYAWNGGGEQKNAEWPGVAMTKTGEMIGGYDVYKYCDPYEKIIFNNSSNQTGDIIWEDGVTYYPNSGLIKMHGNFTGDWNTTEAFAFSKDGKTATLTLSINNAKTYNFGMRIGKDDNWTSNGSSFSREDNSNEITGNSGNCSFDADVTGEYTFTWTFATNTLTITYPQLVTYTVTFNMNGHGTQIEQIEVNKNSKITKPNDPIATGYNFGGWYKESGCTNKYDFNTAVTGDFTLYAKWTPKTYDITYKDQNNANFSGTHEAGHPTQHTYATDTQLKGAGKMGYTFEGWFTNSECTGSAVTTLGATAYTADITLYAKWEIRNLYIHADFVNWEGRLIEPEFKDNTAVYTYTGTLEKKESSWSDLHTMWDGGHHFHYLYSLEGIEKPETQKIAYNYYNVDAGNISYTQDLIDAVHLTDDNNPTIQFGLTKKSKVTITLTLRSDIETNDKATQPDVAIVAIPYNTITLDQTGARTQGTVTSVEVPNGDPMPAITGDGALPTPQIGYTFMGYFDQKDGKGTQYYNASGTSEHAWDKTEDATLYAYFQPAKITNITLEDKEVFEPVTSGEAYVTATPTIDPEDIEGVAICWRLLYSNGDEVTEHKAIDAGDNKVKFSIVGLATGTYTIEATLHATACGNGEPLSTLTKNFIIASEYTVTVKYTCDNQEIKASTTKPAHATEPTTLIAPEIFGYAFSAWEAGDGVEIKTTSGDGKTITYTATYNGTITAKYTKKKLIYLDLSQQFSGSGKWSDPYIYLYGSNGYWDNEKGAGATGDACKAKGAMTKIEGTDIWYYDYSNVAGFTKYLAFTWGNHTNAENFHSCDVIYRGDFSEGTPLFVPATKQTKEEKNGAKYYSKGYWVNYIGEHTGYTLIIYNEAGDKELIRQKFTSANKRMNMTSVIDLEAEHKYQYEVLRDHGYYYKHNSTQLTNSNKGPKPLNTADKGTIVTTAAGDYTFTLEYWSGDLQIKVQYPAAVGDYRILYRDNGTTNWSGNPRPQNWYHPSRIIKKKEGAIDTISFFVNTEKEPKLLYQTINSINASTGAITWSTAKEFEDVKWNVIEKDGVINFTFTQSKDAIAVTNIELYKGNYYIRVDAVDGQWGHYKTNADNRMTYSAFSESDANSFGEKFSHYKTKWCPRGTNVKFTIANDYSPCITDTLIRDVTKTWEENMDEHGKLESDGSQDPTADKYSANIRFMWNRKDNKISRAYLSSATNVTKKFLILQGDDKMKNAEGKEIAATEHVPADATLLEDKQNWIYETTIKVQPGARVKLYACYATPAGQNDIATAQYFRGTNEEFSNASTVQILGGKGETWNTMRVIYDFKTNRLMGAWVPDTEIGDNGLQIDADIMIMREHQEEATCINLTENANSKLTDVKTVYGVMRFNRWILNNRANPKDLDVDHCSTFNGNDRNYDEEKVKQHHPVLPLIEQKSIYERSLYFISFPFDVNLSDVFGFGTYWNEWYIEYYDGLKRAREGFFIDSPPNWKYVTPEMADTFKLRAYQGYILGLDLDYMQYNNTSFWTHNMQEVELFFPSTTTMKEIAKAEVTMPALGPEYECKINRPNSDHRVIDSYWRCIGVPSYANYDGLLYTDEDKKQSITWKTDRTWTGNYTEFPFLYSWNTTDNTITPRSTREFKFKAMHSYLVQNKSQIYWTAVNVNVTPSPAAIMAREMEETKREYEWRITLTKGEKEQDQTFIRLTNHEQVTTEFDFNQDLSKEFNYGRSDIYTLIGNTKAAANSLPFSEQTTLIPLGLSIEYNGDYTIAMPGRMENIGVTLIDTESNTRTNLSAGMEYTLTLNKGDYNNRFFIEISPIQQTPTDIEYVTGDSNSQDSVRKVLIDNILYIVRDGQIFDARGARVK